MAPTLPRFIVITAYNADGRLNYKKDSGGVVVLGEESVFSTLVKIELELSTTTNNLVHLRFCYSNRYWAYDTTQKCMVARSKVPDEDKSKTSCTMFEPTVVNDDGVFFLTHVQSKGRVQIAGNKVNLNSNPKNEDGYLSYVDWDSLVRIPRHVAFKGDNGKFLKAYWFHDLPYLQFSSSDENHVHSGYLVYLMPDGHVRIKCLHFDKFLRYGGGWIWAESGDNVGSDRNTLFWPVKVDDNTIALRSVSNNRFCKRLTADNKENCLNAGIETITSEAKLGVQELVAERKIYNVRYRMEDARIFDEKPFVAGTTTCENGSDRESSISVAVQYTDERSYSFSKTLTISTAVNTTFTADVLGITGGSIEFSYTVSGSYERVKSNTKTNSVTATGTVTVPKKSRAVVNYVGTMGTCTVPFSYIQQDRSSTDGKIVESEEIDGIFTGVNCYNFSFKVLKYEPHL